MSELKVGDVVMIVATASCCDFGENKLGQIHTIIDLHPCGAYCNNCGTFHPVSVIYETDNIHFWLRSMLKKLEPPGLEEEIPTVVNLKEPVCQL